MSESDNTSKKHIPILFSVPVHESPETVIDLICNLNHFNPGCGIVIHISRQFNFSSEWMDEDRFLNALGGFDNVIVNPDRLRTGLEDIIQCHVSNCQYAAEHFDFEYIVFAASNELYVRNGLYDHIRHYDYGPAGFEAKISDDWRQIKLAYQDEEFLNFLKAKGIEKMFGGQIEGSFYKAEILLKCCELISSFYDHNRMKFKYAREEIWFSTFVNHYFPDALIKENSTTYMDWSKNLVVSLSDVLNQTETSSAYYSVKRVPRIIDDPIRSLIRRFIGCYQSEVEERLSKRIDSLSRDEIDKNLEKGKIKCDLALGLVDLKQKGISIARYLSQKGYGKAAIYGYGDFGKRLTLELGNSEIDVTCILDKEATENPWGIKMISPWPDELHADVVIVTVLNSYETIIDETIARYHISCITVHDLIYGCLQQ